MALRLAHGPTHMQLMLRLRYAHHVSEEDWSGQVAKTTPQIFMHYSDRVRFWVSSMV